MNLINCDQAASGIGCCGLAEVRMDWDWQRDRIGFDWNVIFGIWEGLAWAWKFGLALGLQRTGAGL